MNRRKLGHSGLSVSELCLGTMNFGWKINQKKAFSILDSFWEAGGNFFQAIATYPDSDLFPSPEEWLGKWLQSRKIPRDQIVIASRIILPSSISTNTENIDQVIKSWCDRSLQRLKSEYIDVLICEWSRSLLPLSLTMPMLHNLRQSGFHHQVGTANFPLWRTVQMMHIARENQITGIDLAQLEYSLLSPMYAEANILDMATEYDLGFIATGCLGGGILTHREGLPLADRRKDAILRKLIRIAGEHEVSSAEIAMAWVLSNSAVSSAVISVNTVNQLEELVHSTKLTIPLIELSQVRERFVNDETQNQV